MPLRIQRKRTKGWRMPDNTVCVSRPSIFGNPWCVGHNGLYLIHTPDGRGEVRLPAAAIKSQTAADAVARFRAWLDGSMHNWQYMAMMPVEKWREELLHRLPDLRGKNLACWCALDQPCHADVLLEIANA